MTPFVLLVAVFLLTLCEGSRAVIPVFLQKGNDVLLDVKADVPEKFILLVWRFNGSDVLVTYSPDGEPTVSDPYSGRVEVSVENYSVKLKNLQNTDSGVYTARVIASQGKIVAEYNVTVQDPVSPVNLTVNSVSNSSDSCNITVTCRTQDSNISSTFRCVYQICSDDKREKSKTTTSGTFLHVNLVNDSIICNHSNQVSWTTNTGQTKIQDFCPQHDVLYTVVRNGAIIPGIAVGALVSCLLVVVLSIYCCKKKKEKQFENTVYEVPQEINQDQDQNQNPVTSTYALVEFHNGPETTNTSNISPPETIYAQVNRAPKSNSPKSPKTST